MKNDLLGNKAFWQDVCRDIGCGILACAMWMSTFYVVFGGNENPFLTKSLHEISIIDLQALASLFS